MSLKLKAPSDLFFNKLYVDQETSDMEDSNQDQAHIKKKRAPACLSIQCPVCGGPAPDHVHFGGQCCYSCRAFFRRTSIKPISSFRCRSGKNDCIISSGIKSCIPCRLQKCLQVGMDPSLVRGKKSKKELSKHKDKFGANEDEIKKEDDDMFTETKFTPPPMSKIPNYDPAADQENLLKYRAEILKYQGMCLQYQASLLEKEAQSQAKYDYCQSDSYEEGYRKLSFYDQRFHGSHPYKLGSYKTSPVPTIRYPLSQSSPTIPYSQTGVIKSELSPLDHSFNQKAINLGEDTAYDRMQYKLEQRAETPNSDDYEEDSDSTPLDLSLKKSPSNSYHHTQSLNMPRIFFSLGSSKPEY